MKKGEMLHHMDMLEMLLCKVPAVYIINNDISKI